MLGCWESICSIWLHIGPSHLSGVFVPVLASIYRVHHTYSNGSIEISQVEETDFVRYFYLVVIKRLATYNS